MRRRSNLLTNVREYGDRWGFDDYFSSGRRIQVRRHTKKEADAAHLELSILIANGRRDLAATNHIDFSEFRKWQLSTRSSVKVSKAIDDLLSEKKSKGNIGRKWLEKLSDYLDRIKDEFGDEQMISVKANRLERFLSELELSPRSRNNMRAVLVQLWRSARRHGHLPDQTTEAERIEKLKIKKAESITVWTPDEMIAILNAAEFEERPWFLIGGFAGVRTEELMPEYSDKSPLDWSDFDWHENLIHMRAATSKVNEARDIPILPNLREWLQPYQMIRGPVMPQTFSYRPSQIWKRIKNRTDMTQKSGNRNRHSFGTYRLGDIKDIEQVSYEMGTSIYKIKSSYSRPKNPSVIKAWWSILPTQASNIRQFPKSQVGHKKRASIHRKSASS
jgi:integrase